MPIECTPGNLIDQSKCILSCTDEGQRQAIMVWLLAQKAGVNSDPGFLLDQARCLFCLDEGQLRAIQAWLLCQIFNSGGSECPTISFCTESLPSGVECMDYSQVISASCGTGPYSYELTSGVLPDGITLSIGGVVSGVPTTSGNFIFTVKATDSKNCTGSKEYSIKIESHLDFSLRDTNPFIIDPENAPLNTGYSIICNNVCSVPPVQGIKFLGPFIADDNFPNVTLLIFFKITPTSQHVINLSEQFDLTGVGNGGTLSLDVIVKTGSWSGSVISSSSLAIPVGPGSQPESCGDLLIFDADEPVYITVSINLIQDSPGSSVEMDNLILSSNLSI